GAPVAGGAAGLDPESFHPQRGPTQAPKETLVPQGAEMEDGVRGPDQRAQTTARAQPQPLSGSGRDGTVGRIRGGRRHAHQYGKSFGKPEERIKPYAACGEKTSLGRRKKPGPHQCTLGQGP